MKVVDKNNKITQSNYTVNVNNMALAGAGAAYTAASGYAFSQLNKLLRRGLYGDGKNDRVKFYYRDDQRSFLRVAVNSVVQQVAQQAVNELMGYGIKALKDKVSSLFDKKKEAAKAKIISGSKKETEEYGTIKVKATDGQYHSVPCYDWRGNICQDGLMASTPSKKAIKYSVYRDTLQISGGHVMDSFTANTLVWSDPTALISVNSSKNVVLTRVVGRDYSRKELISNGDIEISVSGHLLAKTSDSSSPADNYPTQEVAKFLQTMQYKGIVEVNNIILNQLGITKILIKDFSLPSNEGYKQKQDYSFNAVCIQPVSEVQVNEDTLDVINDALSEAEGKTSEWGEFLKNKALGATDAVSDIATSAASGVGSLIKL